jgi:hypothetical protein
VSSWADFVRQAEPSDHAAQVYREPGDLVRAVAAYLTAGFETGERGLVVATPEHQRLISARLTEAGWDEGTLAERNLLFTADAEATLRMLVRDGSPSAAAFEDVVGALLDRVAAPLFRRRIRVFGEMVDLLCRRGRAADAAALEAMWNDLARTRTFSLLCGYRLDLFDHAAQTGPLQDVCRAHTHVIPAADPARFARAVDRALEDVLGAEGAGRVYVLVGGEIRRERIPTPQLVLSWVSANMPVLAGRVLSAARAHYAADPAAA